MNIARHNAVTHPERLLPPAGTESGIRIAPFIYIGGFHFLDPLRGLGTRSITGDVSEDSEAPGRLGNPFPSWYVEFLDPA